MNAQTRGRRFLLFMALLFLGPMLLAWALHARGWRPGAQVNHGVIVSPAVTLPPFGAALPAGTRSPRQGAWSLMVVAPIGCDEACRAALEGTQRVRALLGRNRDRVQRVLIAPGAGAERELLAAHVDLVAFDGASAAGAALLAAFPPPAESGAVFIADPRGNLALRYAAGQEPKDILDDLGRLLKYSN